MATNEEIRAIQMRPTVFRREAWQSEIDTQRKAIFRDCPAGVVVDRGQAITRAAGVMLAGMGAPMALRYLIRGLLSDGFTAAEVAHALKATKEEMARAQGELPIHEPGAKKLAELRQRELSHQSNDEGYNVTSSPGDKRQGDLVRGSRGWRTPEHNFPQTTTPPHA
jgi:hypothetical protein